MDLSTMLPEQLRPLKRVEYERLIELGCFEDEKVELIDGLLVAMSPQGDEHRWAVMKLTKLFVPAVGERALVLVQGSFAANEDSLPEPDLVLLPNQDYSHTPPTQAFLVIEVAQSSLRKDRLIKTRLYARAGVAEYWIVNLTSNEVEVHREPRDDRYARVTTYGRADTISPEAFPDIAVRIADVLPT